MKKQVEDGTASIYDYMSALNNVDKYATDLNTQIDKMQSSYRTLSDALVEYNETGMFQIDTLQSILSLSPEYINALDLENGQLVINKQRALELVNALKEEAVVKLQNAAVSDVKALADGRVNEMSNLAKSAVAGLGDSAETAGNQVAEASGKMYDFAASVTSVLASEGVDTSGIKEQVDSIIGAYSNAASTIGKIKVDFSGVSGSRKTKSSTASKKDNEVKNIELDNLLLLQKEYNELENQLTKILDKKEDITLSTDEQLTLAQKEIDLLKQQQNIQHQMANQRREDIQPQLLELKKYGVNVEFNPKINQLEFHRQLPRLKKQ